MLFRSHDFAKKGDPANVAESAPRCDRPEQLIATCRELIARLGEKSLELEKAAGEMRRIFKIRPADLRAAIGPSIGVCCYEVSEDLAGAMKGLAVAAMTEADMLQTRGW